jgi:hypothetical protein
MVTSKSAKELQTCIGGALIFSGRPNPTWHVRKVIVQQLKEIWSLLEHFQGEPAIAPPLGYRGCFLKCKPDLEWIAYGGIVALKTSDTHESRRDNDRRFEKLLLTSAPEGILPAFLLNDKQRIE